MTNKKFNVKPYYSTTKYLNSNINLKKDCHYWPFEINLPIDNPLNKNTIKKEVLKIYPEIKSSIIDIKIIKTIKKAKYIFLVKDKEAPWTKEE